MAVYEINEKVKKKRIVGLVEFPPYARGNFGSVTHMVTSHLRRLLEFNKQRYNCEGLVIPSVTVLSGYFNCTELDVLEAFHELRRQGYDYEIHGLDMPISYYDPLVREPLREHTAWNSLSEMFTRVWQALHSERSGTLRPTS